MKKRILSLALIFISISIVIFHSFQYMDTEVAMREHLSDFYEKKYDKKIIAFSDVHGSNYKAIGCVDEDQELSMFIFEKHPVLNAYRIKGKQPAIEPTDDIIIRYDISKKDDQVSLFCVNNLDNQVYMLNLWNLEYQKEFGVGINKPLEVIAYADTSIHYSKYYLRDEYGKLISQEYEFE